MVVLVVVCSQLLNIGIVAICHMDMLTVRLDFVHGILAHAVGHKHVEVHASLSQVLAVGSSSIARRGHTKFFYTVFLEDRGSHRSGHVFKSVGTSVQVVAIDHHLTVDTEFLQGIFLHEIPFLNRNSAFSVGDDIFAVIQRQVVEIQPETVGRLLVQFCQLGVIGRIADVSIVTATFGAALVLCQPLPEVLRHMTAFFTYNRILHKILNCQLSTINYQLSIINCQLLNYSLTRLICGMGLLYSPASSFFFTSLKTSMVRFTCSIV